VAIVASVEADVDSETLKIGGDAIGLIAVVGTVAALTMVFRLGWWLLLAGSCGVLLAVVLRTWRSRHRTRPISILDS
jgi:hypothetical protein